MITIFKTKKKGRLILRLSIDWFYSDGEKTDDFCEEINFSDYPECSDDEILIFNNFGQTVCHCGPDTFPLEDPSLDLDDEKGPFSNDHMLGMDPSLGTKHYE